jgi:hypothetical protein
MVRNENGQSLVEMALVLPVMLMLLLGIFDFGRIFYSYIHLNLASQESVRLAGLGKSDSEVKQFAKDYIHVGSPSQLDVDVSPGDTIRGPGDYVTVKLSLPFTIITPFLSSVVPSPLLINTESTIRVE